MGSYSEWIQGPFGLDIAKGATVSGQRVVLVVVHHVTAGTRLTDVLPLLEKDRRVQVVYTAAPASTFSKGAVEFLEGLDGLVLPWAQATQMNFDLAIAASHGMLENIRAPILTLPHGSGPNKLLIRIPGFGPPAARPVTGLIRERLIVSGRVVPSSIVVAHEQHRRLLIGECPEASPVVIVGGDPCLDRLVASVPLRETYRRALGAGRHQQLVFITSTWSPTSLLGQHPDLLLRAATELPQDRYRVVVALHPHIWTWYGRRQLKAWYSDCLQLGVQLLPPEEGWRAALVAADIVVGDHGSVTYYGAAMGIPVLLAAFPEDDVASGSNVTRLGDIAPRLDWERPLRLQLNNAVHAYDADTYATIRNDLSSKPGMSAQILRTELYRLMRLSEPVSPPRVDPVPLPYPIQYDGAQAA